MWPTLPDLSADLDDPHMLAIRRFCDLSLSLPDFIDDPDDLDRNEMNTDKHFSVKLDGGCGYDLRVEMRLRHVGPETGFTLIQQGFVMHTPMMRFSRVGSDDWIGVHWNIVNDSDELRFLARLLGFRESGQRLPFNEPSVNWAFGSLCRLMAYGRFNV